MDKKPEPEPEPELEPVTPPPVVVEPPAPKQDFFPFLEGEHDGGVAAGGRCISAGWLYCEPWDIDGDGVYDGMKGS